jgi:hypothetical protein
MLQKGEYLWPDYTGAITTVSHCNCAAFQMACRFINNWAFLRKMPVQYPDIGKYIGVNPYILFIKEGYWKDMAKY